jgi:small nuclear ribonucleoprotein D3
VYIRGSKIRFIILPDMLKNAPMFKNLKGPKSSQGRGKTAIIRASVNRGAGAAAGRGGRGGAASDRGGASGRGGPAERGGPAGRSRGTNVYQKR